MFPFSTSSCKRKKRGNTVIKLCKLPWYGLVGTFMRKCFPSKKIFDRRNFIQKFLTSITLGPTLIQRVRLQSVILKILQTNLYSMSYGLEYPRLKQSRNTPIELNLQKSGKCPLFISLLHLKIWGLTTNRGCLPSKTSTMLRTQIIPVSLNAS